MNCNRFPYADFIEHLATKKMNVVGSTHYSFCRDLDALLIVELDLGKQSSFTSRRERKQPVCIVILVFTTEECMVFPNGKGVTTRSQEPARQRRSSGRASAQAENLCSSSTRHHHLIARLVHSSPTWRPTRRRPQTRKVYFQ